MKIMSKTFKTLLGGGLVLLLSLVAINHAGAQTCVQPPSGLVSWWPGDGNANDIQNGNDGTLLGGTFFTPAKVGKGFTFDSDDDRVTIPHNANLNVNSPGFTADFWMQGTKSQPQSLYLVVDKSHGFVDNTGWVFQGVSATGELFFGIGDGVGFPGVTSVVDVLDGNLHHIAGTWDGSLIQLYVDGVPQGSVPLTTPANNTRAVNIAFAWGGGSPQRFFRGIVDELEIFNRALFVGEVLAIHNAGRAGKCKASTDLDHFKCYNAKGGPPNVTVDLEDQFGVKPGVLVEKPEFFCNPVDKNGEGIRNPAAHLTCYKIKGDGEKRGVVVGNQFGGQTLEVKKAELLCVPSDKTEVIPEPGR